MNRKRTLWIIIGALIFVNLLISGFALMQPTAQDILVEALDAAKAIEQGHAIVEIVTNSPDKNASGRIEIWALRGEDGPGAFRLEVIDASDPKALGAVIVSDGETLWVYAKVENKVFMGTLDEARAMLESKGPMRQYFGEFYSDKGSLLEESENDHPENAEDAVQKLAEYFNISKSDRETVASEKARKLVLEPVAEKMPVEFAAMGGIVNLWIGQDSSLPLAATYTGSSLGDVSATVVSFDFDDIDESHFTFTVPGDAEVVTIADLEPQSLTLDEATATTGFTFLTPAETPPGATLVDILDVRGTVVLRYTLPAGGSFTISQGVIAKSDTQDGKSPETGQTVTVRGGAGQLFESEDGDKVLLTWSEGDLLYAVAGELTAEDALIIAESLE